MDVPRHARALTSHEESHTHPNTDRESHVDDPSGVSRPYATSEPAASTRGVAACVKPISRMLRQAPFPEHSFGHAYLRLTGVRPTGTEEEKGRQGHHNMSSMSTSRLLGKGCRDWQRNLVG